ncbi:alpha/beta fold hydrolase [Planococcus sp. CP5-4]|uniref:alpha/beta fold hydrolase n=1 Tax=unclassified Planococcus (in: firmicutes) TaxID=2662419 RepID=UPI001C224BF4|nr:MULTISPECIES: alpha/beta hydrolase [unclassified Planococcus (in: firmicutes)]MBU9675186.1 alpha/beta fold hydrolase [Planococcus sp. CP5-4_YE]MBV0910698.1 alpha/beta fold hydrolase [Planococcus sp. CP5-4_UN]MBW6062091.1 alpha/beta fold hydrolase [Planococcus sp. CP5-4]
MKKEIIKFDNGLQIGMHLWGNMNHTTLLFLHGLGSSAASFTELANLLSQKYSIIALDLPGHGLSTAEQAEESFSAASMARWVKEAMEQLDIKDLHVIGHSIGGNIALVFAKIFSVQSVILLDGGYIRSSSIPGSSITEEIRFAKEHCVNHAFSSWTQFEEKMAEEGLIKRLIEMVKPSMQAERDAIKLILTSEHTGYYVKQHFNEPSMDTLSDIDVAVLLLRSTLPKAFNSHRESETARLQQYLALSVEEVKDTSHDIYWENPEVVSQKISQWISRKK